MTESTGETTKVAVFLDFPAEMVHALAKGWESTNPFFGCRPTIFSSWDNVFALSGIKAIATTPTVLAACPVKTLQVFVERQTPFLIVVHDQAASELKPEEIIGKLGRRFSYLFVSSGGPHFQTSLLPSGLQLTSREMEVLKGIVNGMPNREIGNRLFIDETTVKTHVRRIFRKLGCRRREEVIAIAIRRGLVR